MERAEKVGFPIMVKARVSVIVFLRAGGGGFRVRGSGSGCCLFECFVLACVYASASSVGAWYTPGGLKGLRLRYARVWGRRDSYRML